MNVLTPVYIKRTLNCPNRWMNGVRFEFKLIVFTNSIFFFIQVRKSIRISRKWRFCLSENSFAGSIKVPVTPWKNIDRHCLTMYYNKLRHISLLILNLSHRSLWVFHSKHWRGTINLKNVMKDVDAARLILRGIFWLNHFLASSENLAALRGSFSSIVFQKRSGFGFGIWIWEILISSTQLNFFYHCHFHTCSVMMICQ